MHPLVDDADGLAAVVLEVADLRDQLAAIATGVTQLRAAVETLAAADDTTAEPIWCWSDLDAESAERAWVELTAWLETVLLPRYPDAARVLYPCWYRHPNVLDSLTALYATWRAAYRTRKAPVVLAASWLDR